MRDSNGSCQGQISSTDYSPRSSTYMYVHSDMATIADIDEPARLYATSKSQQLSSVQVQLSPVESEQRAVQFGAEIPLHLQSACKAPIYLSHSHQQRIERTLS
jgi:hypothetical protein